MLQFSDAGPLGLELPVSDLEIWQADLGAIYITSRNNPE